MERRTTRTGTLSKVLQRTAAGIVTIAVLSPGATWGVLSFEKGGFLYTDLEEGNGVGDVATDGNSTWLVVANGVVYRRSTDGGRTFGPEIELDDPVNFGLLPQVAADGLGTWVAVWTFRNFPSYTSHLLVARSADDAASWSTPAILDAGAAADTLADDVHDLQTDGAGTWMVAWVKYDPDFDSLTPVEVYVARSLDDGVTWSSPFLLGTGSSVAIQYRQRPRLATDGTGTWLAVWDTDVDLAGTGADFDVAVRRSTDDGASWTAAVPLNTNATTDSGRDRNPNVAYDGSSGTWIAVWDSTDQLAGILPAGEDDRNILMARSTDGGSTWTPPSVVNRTAHVDGKANDDIPTLATDGMGSWVVAWRSDLARGGAGRDVDSFFAWSRDGGSTWSTPAALNLSYNTDNLPTVCNGAQDAVQAIESDGHGTWIAAYHSFSNCAGVQRLTYIRSVSDCPETPSEMCRAPVTAGHSTLMVRDSLLLPDRVVWVWRSGSATSAEDLGDPLSTSDYAFCVYDETGGVPELVLEKEARGGTICIPPSTPCWEALPGDQFRYRDVGRLAAQEVGALRKLLLRAGEDGRARIVLVANGLAVAPAPLPLSSDPRVRAQLHNLETGVCWEGIFSVPIKNDGTIYRAKSD